MKTIDLVYGDTPPSLNTLGTRGTHWPVTNAKKRWEGIFTFLLLEQKASHANPLPRRLKRVRASAVLRFPTRHRRDEGNYRWLLEKALGDALQGGGYLADDTPEFFTFEEVTFEAERGKAQTTVTLRYEA